MGSNSGPNIADAGWQVRVIDTILQNTYQIFDDDWNTRRVGWFERVEHLTGFDTNRCVMLYQYCAWHVDTTAEFPNTVAFLAVEIYGVIPTISSLVRGWSFCRVLVSVTTPVVSYPSTNHRVVLRPNPLTGPLLRLSSQEIVVYFSVLYSISEDWELKGSW